jgi:uncharacterized protein YukE
MSKDQTSSAALIELKNDLTQLSKALHVIYDLMNADMRQLGDTWQDGKYQEFVQGYQPQIQKCEEIANRYADGCARVLEPTIQNVVVVEKADVSGASIGAGGSVGGGNAVGNTSSGVSSSATADERFSGFNI